MNRTAVRWSLKTLLLIAIVAITASLAPLGATGFSEMPVSASAPADEPVTTDVSGQPPVTANDFLPEDRDVTDCIGVLERPGCGSESRGGWRQTAILGAIFIGLGIVFGNVIRGVRKNRSAM